MTMNPINRALEDKIAFYNNPKLVEDPCHPAGFAGTFAFSNHNLIPDVFNGYLQRYFGVLRLSKIKIEYINKALNEVWEGPGSLEKIFRLEYEMFKSNKQISITPRDIVDLKKNDVEDDDDVLELSEDVFEFGDE